MREEFRIGEWLVHPHLTRVTRDGETVRVTPRAMAVLVYLADARGAVVSRNEILDAVWPGMAVTPDALSQCLSELRRVFRDSSKTPAIIETIPKIGVRLLAPVTPAGSPHGGGTQRSPRGVADAAFAPAEKPVVAALPFDNLSASSENAMIGAGVHEEILGKLAQLHSLEVISRSAVLDYTRANRPTIEQISRELGARFIIEGSCRFNNGQVRIEARLIDAATGRYLWSDRYAGEIHDLFEFQADIARKVADALRAELSLAEQERLDRPPTVSPEAYRLYLEAQWIYFSVSPTSTLARTLVERALDLDPEFALAHALIAAWEAPKLINSIDGAAVDAAARAALEQAVRTRARLALDADPNVLHANAALAVIDFLQWRWTQALQGFERALALAPSDLRASGLGSWLNALLGRDDEAIRIAKQGVKLNPTIGDAHRTLGVAHGFTRNYAAAADSLKIAVDMAPADPFSSAWLAYVEIGRGALTEGGRLLARTERMLEGDRAVVFLPELALGYARVGCHEDARRLFGVIQKIAAERDLGAGAHAMAHVAVGEYGEALKWLEVAAERVRNHEIDDGFWALNNLRMNVVNEPALERREFKNVLSRLKGD